MVVIRGSGGLELVEYGSVDYVRRSYAASADRRAVLGVSRKIYTHIDRIPWGSCELAIFSSACSEYLS